MWEDTPPKLAMPGKTIHAPSIPAPLLSPIELLAVALPTPLPTRDLTETLHMLSNFDIEELQWELDNPVDAMMGWWFLRPSQPGRGSLNFNSNNNDSGHNYGDAWEPHKLFCWQLHHTFEIGLGQDVNALSLHHTILLLDKPHTTPLLLQWPLHLISAQCCHCLQCCGMDHHHGGRRGVSHHHGQSGV